MDNSVTARICRLHDGGFTNREIANLTALPIETVRRTTRPPGGATLKEVAQTMIRRRTPGWWKSSRAEYESCVRANFKDVLGG